ncbi:hypothetical protein GCM10023259_061260 [Thermocatellispora tengchongensis]
MAGVTFITGPAHAAAAGTVSLGDDGLTFTAGANVANRLTITRVGDQIRFVDIAAPVTENADLCTTFNNNAGTGVLCDVAVASRVNVYLRDEADLLTALSTVPYHVEGGAGDDEISTGDGTDTVRGGIGDDTIEDVGDGNDVVYGEAGQDEINIDDGLGRDTAYGGLNADTINADDGLRDIIRCGDGVFDRGDKADIDANDSALDCDSVF